MTLPQTFSLTDPAEWDEVDRLVEQMGRIDLHLAKLDTGYTSKLYNLLRQYRDDIADLVERREAIEHRVKGFCEQRKAEFANRRSRKLTFGKVSFRVAERIVVPKDKEEIVITTLLALGLSDCVNVIRKLDLGAMSKLSDSDLARAGARREKTDHCRVEPNVEYIAKQVGAEVDIKVKRTLDIGKLAATAMDQAV